MLACVKGRLRQDEIACARGRLLLPVTIFKGLFRFLGEGHRSGRLMTYVRETIKSEDGCKQGHQNLL